MASGFDRIYENQICHKLELKLKFVTMSAIKQLIKQKLESKICIELEDESILKLLPKIESYEQCSELKFEYFQINITQLTDFNITDLHQISPKLKPKVILNFANKLPGTKSSNDLEVIQKAIRLGFGYIKIDYNTAVTDASRIQKPNEKPKKKKNQLLETKSSNPPLLDLNLKHPDTQIIIGYYNYSKVPSFRKLRSLHDKIRSLGCDVAEFGCQCNSKVDNINLVRLLTSKTQQQKISIRALNPESSSNFKQILVANCLFGGYTTIVSENNINQFKELVEKLGLDPK